MNDELQSFEAELASLQPQRPSAELAERIAAELQAPPAPKPRRSHRRTWLAAVAAGAVAASIAAAVWLWPRGGDEVAGGDSPGDLTQPRVSAAFDPGLPSVWSFRSAALRSPAELDSLLDQHTARGAPPRTEFVQTRGFGASETELHDLLGEL